MRLDAFGRVEAEQRLLTFAPSGREGTGSGGNAAHDGDVNVGDLVAFGNQRGLTERVAEAVDLGGDDPWSGGGLSAIADEEAAAGPLAAVAGEK